MKTKLLPIETPSGKALKSGLIDIIGSVAILLHIITAMRESDSLVSILILADEFNKETKILTNKIKLIQDEN